MNYSESLAFLGQVRRFGVKLGLENMQALAQRLGDPQRRLKFIHIAGTNGKGSTAAFCARILREAGFKTGLYTSPHLVSLGERIQIDGVPLSPDAVAEGMTVLQEHIRAVEQTPGGAAPTFFEVLTALALWQFDRNKVDWVVWETGLGGRLDATNIVTPEISIITNIAIDHSMHLGKHLDQIAYEKAGIIKPGVPIVTAVKTPAALEVITSGAMKKQSPLCLVGLDVPTINCGIHNGHQHAMIGNEPYRLGLLGAHQVDNAGCAYAAMRLLEARGALPSNDTALRNGFRNVEWPARFQVIRHSPPLVLDGAHNPDAVERLIETWHACYGERLCHLVCAFMEDKEYATMLPRLLTLADRVTLVRAQTERSLDPEKLLPLCGDVRARVASCVTEVWEELKQPQTEPTLMAGSLFLAGEVLALRGGHAHQIALNEKLAMPTERTSEEWRTPSSKPPA